MKIEEWRPVKGFDDYDVSDLGNVRSWRPRNGRGKRAKKPLLLKPSSIQGKKYLRVTLSDGFNTSAYKVHRLVLETFVGECPAGMEGCHNDGNAANNRLDNLRWDTHANNILDQITHETALFGDSHPRSVLTEKQVEEIKGELSNHKHGLSRLLARKFNVSESAISSIKRSRTWSTV